MNFNKLIRYIAYLIYKLFFRNKSASVPFVNDSPRILIYRCDAIGDYIVTTPSIKLIKDKMPRAVIDMIVSKRNIELAKNNPSINRIFLFDETLIGALKLRHELKSNNYDLCICFNLFKTSKIGSLLNIMLGPEVIKTGIEHSARKKEYSALFNYMIPVERNKYNIVEFHARIVSQLLGFQYNVEQLEFELKTIPESDNFVSAFLESRLINEFITYNISAGNTNRMWSAGRHIEFLKMLLNEFPSLKIVLLAAPPEKEASEQIFSALNGKIVQFPIQNYLSNIISLVDKSTMIISPDTAIIHFAAARKKPVLGLFTSSTSFLNEWMPFGCEYEKVVSPDKLPVGSIAASEVLDKFRLLYKRIN